MRPSSILHTCPSQRRHPWARMANMLSMPAWLLTSYDYLILTLYWTSLVYFSGLKYVLGRQILHFNKMRHKLDKVISMIAWGVRRPSSPPASGMRMSLSSRPLYPWAQEYWRPTVDKMVKLWILCLLCCLPNISAFCRVNVDLWMDFRICNQQTAEKENFGVHQVLQNGEPPNVVSILKTSQRTNLPLEKKLTKVSLSILKFQV